MAPSAAPPCPPGAGGRGGGGGARGSGAQRWAHAPPRHMHCRRRTRELSPRLQTRSGWPSSASASCGESPKLSERRAGPSRRPRSGTASTAPKQPTGGGGGIASAASSESAGQRPGGWSVVRSFLSGALRLPARVCGARMRCLAPRPCSRPATRTCSAVVDADVGGHRRQRHRELGARRRALLLGSGAAYCLRAAAALRLQWEHKGGPGVDQRVQLAGRVHLTCAARGRGAAEPAASEFRVRCRCSPSARWQRAGSASQRCGVRAHLARRVRTPRRRGAARAYWERRQTRRRPARTRPGGATGRSPQSAAGAATAGRSAGGSRAPVAPARRRRYSAGPGDVGVCGGGWRGAEPAK